ncbi:MAG: IPT/TIG domain-containing protein [Acidobacteria bacterium]|nr:IPT/TIG domain-containing protein [Acidobacteriota bacterium]
MKRFIPFIALLTLVVMVGCSADSPKPSNGTPGVVPTPASDTWAVSSLTASNTAPFVGSVILLQADVTLNSSEAPDDTVVTFEASGGEFSSGSTTASPLTSDGSASVAFVAEEAGSYAIRARVKGASREIVVEYQDRASTDALQLSGVDPRRGSYAGGDQVTITGKGIQAPVDVFFDLDGFPYQAIIVGVTESDPLSADGTITVVTPAFTGTDTGIQQTADVRVNTNAGTGSQESDTLPDAFVLLPGGGPLIFGVQPASGRSSGGEVVNVLGQGFGSVASDLSVSFADTAGVVKIGTVISVSPDGTQIQVETPRFSTVPLTADEPQDVTVATVDGVTSLEDAFIVLADEPTPEIASISPTAGPLDGGTLVTIFGSGFQVPMQVFFGNLTAIDVNVFNDTTPADNDRITCVTPDYSQQGDVPPVEVDVRVRNMNSGNEASYSSFTYGDPLYITGNTPTEGGLGDLVIIYGSGFEDPLQVFLGNALMEVISVSGTELVVKIPDDLATECGGSAGTFEVVLLETGLRTSGGNFRIVGNTPTVLSVNPIILQEQMGGDLYPNDITITGQSFADEVLVQVGSYIMPSSYVTVNSDTSIDVDNLPEVSILGITFGTTPCTTAGGLPGAQSSATPLPVSVTNFPGSCTDTLAGALVVEPLASTCTALSMSVSPTNIDFGTSASTQTFTITNDGPGPYGWTTTLSDSDGVFTVSPTTGYLSPGEAVLVNVTFSYAGGAGTHNGSISFTTNPVGVPGSEVTVTLNAETPP